MTRLLRALALLALMATGAPAAAETAVATFAGGCFWCVEEAFEEVDGVIEAVSGYTGGTVAEPSYKQVTSGRTGHFEAVEVRYDPAKIDYAGLLDIFWRNIDPLDDTGQFCDKGDQYRSAIFVHDETQRRLAEESKRKIMEMARFEAPIVTQILPAGPFYEAEDYHQDYAHKNPIRYTFYRTACGRDGRLKELWGG